MGKVSSSCWKNLAPRRVMLSKKRDFVGPDITNLMKDEKFDQHMNSLELRAWR